MQDIQQLILTAEIERMYRCTDLILTVIMTHLLLYRSRNVLNLIEKHDLFKCLNCILSIYNEPSLLFCLLINGTLY